MSSIEVAYRFGLVDVDVVTAALSHNSFYLVTNRPNLFEYEVYSIRDTGETWRGVNFPNLSLHDLRDRKVGTNPLFHMVNN